MNLFIMRVKLNNNQLFSNGGRVLNITAIGKNFYKIRKKYLLF